MLIDGVLDDEGREGGDALPLTCRHNMVYTLLVQNGPL